MVFLKFFLKKILKFKNLDRLKMEAEDLTLEFQDTIYFRFTQLFPAA